MTKARELVGKRFGRYVIVDKRPSEPTGHSRFLAQCDCGTLKVVRGQALTSGATVSCGCHSRAQRTTHGMTGTRTYKTWLSMKERCLNPLNSNFPAYGQRGVTVCERWRTSFDNFLADMGERPPGRTLDRIDVNGNYEPENCRWATPVEQANNRRPRAKKPLQNESVRASRQAD